MISPATGAHSKPRDLLEVGELRDLHAVAPALPAEPPGAERRALPVVLDEADVVQLRVDADRVERARDRAPGCPAATASGSPGTGSSAAAGSGSRRSGRPSAGARAARRRRSRASARARAASSPDGRCRRPPPCRRAAGSRSPGPPSSAAASGSGPGTSVPGAYGRARRRTSCDSLRGQSARRTLFAAPLEGQALAPRQVGRLQITKMSPSGGYRDARACRTADVLSLALDRNRTCARRRISRPGRSISSIAFPAGGPTDFVGAPGRRQAARTPRPNLASWSRTRPAPTARSAPTTSRSPRRTVTRCSSPRSARSR